MSIVHHPAPSPSKLLIQMSGAPGSGKSTLARHLRSRITDSIIIDHDVLRSSLLECDVLSFGQAAKQAYALQWNLARDSLSQGVSVVIMDSTCNYPEVVEQGSSLATRHGYSYRYVECKVGDLDMLDQRLRARQPMVSQRSGIDCPPPAAAEQRRSGEVDSRALFTRWIESPCHPEDENSLIIVDGTVSPEVLCQQVLKKLVNG